VRNALATGSWPSPSNQISRSSCPRTESRRQYLTKEEADSNDSVLVVAGTETVATSLSGLVYLLLKHLEAMTRLTKEVRSAFHGTTPKLTSGDLKSLRCLSACIEETLRLYPPTPTGSARLVPSQVSTVYGLPVPRGVGGLL
jgi:cytochrome P450